MRRCSQNWTVVFALALAPLVPVRVAAQSQINFSETPLPVFELHSGFWINLHHTLYREARQRKAAASREGNPGMRALPTDKTVPLRKMPLSAAEQRVWDDAIVYYGA